MVFVFLMSIFINGCRGGLLEFRASNLGSEVISETECDFAGTYFRFGALVKNAVADLYGPVRYKGTNCVVQYRRASGQIVKKTINVTDKIEWLKKNCKGKEGVMVKIRIWPEKDSVEIEVDCKD